MDTLHKESDSRFEDLSEKDSKIGQDLIQHKVSLVGSYGKISDSVDNILTDNDLVSSVSKYKVVEAENIFFRNMFYQTFHLPR